MASALVGTVASRVLSRRFSAGQLLATATAIALFSIAAATLIIYPTETTTVSLASYQVLLTLLCTFELAVGLYLPSMNKLQTELVPTDERAAVVGLFRVPLNLIATVGLLMLHHYGSDRRYGNWLILLM
jgi:MFS family permease